MSEPDILYPAIFVFTMLLIGLGLTMWEFTRLQKSARVRQASDKPVSGMQPEQTGDRLRKAASF